MECSVSLANRAFAYACASKTSSVKVNLKPGLLASKSKRWIGIGSGSGKGVKIDKRGRWEASACRQLPPLEPQSAVGRLLNEILQKHSHLFHVAATQQLAKLAGDRDEAIARQQLSAADPLSVLHRRIAELKAGECGEAAEEVIYLLIVKRFAELCIPMVPRLMSSESGRVDSWPSKDTELESIHSPEVLDMIKDHLSMILGRRGGLDIHIDNHTVAQIDRPSLGRVYAASIMYGYFLKRVHQRYQLETILERPAYPNVADADRMTKQVSEDGKKSTITSLPVKPDGRPTSDLYPICLREDASKSGRFRSYITSFDAETLQRCATMRSKESVNVIEKHASALFGRPEMHTGGEAPYEETIINLTYSSLRRLVLEAVAFGSFLWDVEDYVHSQYTLTGN